MRPLRQTLGLLALAHISNAETVPYNPSRIFLSPNSSIAYIFRPATQLSNQAQLSALDYGNPFESTTFAPTSISDTLPFLQDDELVPYTPTIDTAGNITVVTGNCSDGAGATKVWKFEPFQQASGAGSWSQYQTSDHELGNQKNIAGSNFLAGSIAFSQYIYANATDTSVFIFGGMCPMANSTADTWISDAKYSNSMLSLSPASSAGSETYQIAAVPSAGPPIPQAGASITGLPPTYSLNASGQPQTQQQDFVLLGGHTESAFINTSQVALFSLPQQSWSFVPVLQPSDARTDLTARQDSGEVTPRSGHTAILAEDGHSIVFFGGWVGDVNTPASPQLAILDLGSGYGGNGDWTWRIPQPSGSGPSAGSGIYGHGAAMLPGGMMMIVGGYNIPDSSSSRRLKRDVQSSNKQMYLYNTTSNAWTDSYNPPLSLQKQFQEKVGALSRTSQKVGLGTGLSIGAALLVTVLAFYFWYSKRLKRARAEKERKLISYSSDGSSVGQMEQNILNHGDVSGRGADQARLGRFWPTGGLAGSTYPPPPPMQHTTGMWVDVPSPTRGLRKSTAAGKDYQYQPAPRYDDKRISRNSGVIHPIVEHENEDGASLAGSERDGLTDAESKLREVERVLHSNPEDPFDDPEPNPLGSHPVSPVITSDTLRRVPTGASRMSVPPRRPLSGAPDGANWEVERGPNESLLEDDNGRTSPSRSDERTSSTLSERSQRSATSSNSITRTMSTRTGAIMAAAVAAHRASAVPQETPATERTQTMSTDGGRSTSPSYFRTRARSSTNGSMTPGVPHSASTDADSFTTAKSKFAHVQSEGDTLLGSSRPNLSMDRDDPYQRALAAYPSTRADMRQPSGRAPPQIVPTRKRQGLMGSLRRALNAVSMSERSFSLTTASSEPYKDDFRSSSSSPTKDRAGKIGTTPRRAVSDGGALLRQKRGQQDWQEKAWPPYRDNPDVDDWGEPLHSVNVRHAEEDWDVEGEASKRDFQVMFTIPKSRLRVVNDDMDRASLRSASDGAVSRQGSMKNLRREESLKGLRARSDGDRLLLPSTEEERDELEKEKAA